MDAQLIQALKEGYKKLPAQKQEFAQSLVRQFEKKGQLSDKQWPYVDVLVDLIECVGVPDFTKPRAVELGSFQGVIDLFKTAKQHLKYPAIELALGTKEDIEAGNSQTVMLKLAGPNSKYYGSVLVTDGKPFGQNKWFGSISKDGAWEPGHKAEAIMNDLTNILSLLAKNPVRVAAEFGKLTGRCCFCRIKLTDEKSTDVGYGPVCAKHYGLPWGKT